MLLPFIGFRAREHFGPDGPRTTTRYDTDQSGRIEYRFNALGYRGEEFDPDAKRHIYVCGCSYMFGLGVDYTETAAYKFKRLYADAHGLAPEQVNLLNFSMGSASNDYIGRTLVSQMMRKKPDLVVAAYTHLTRAEYVNAGDLGPHVYAIGPWYTFREKWDERLTQAQQVDVEGVDSADALDFLIEAGMGYYTYYTDDLGVLSFLRNALMVQLLCEKLRVPYVAALADWQRFWSALDGFASGPLAAALDKSVFIPPSEMRPPMPEAEFLQRLKDDVAADGIHFGGWYHGYFAQKFLDVYRQKYLEQR
ncbi:MAG: hypothetical protein Q7V01_06880 [Vicinamibacterales bacterium]|nr:hypothetical protein [Vicinamibacterales bacterium]